MFTLAFHGTRNDNHLYQPWHSWVYIFSKYYLYSFEYPVLMAYEQIVHEYQALKWHQQTFNKYFCFLSIIKKMYNFTCIEGCWLLPDSSQSDIPGSFGIEHPPGCPRLTRQSVQGWRGIPCYSHQSILVQQALSTSWIKANWFYQ